MKPSGLTLLTSTDLAFWERDEKTRHKPMTRAELRHSYRLMTGHAFPKGENLKVVMLLRHQQNCINNGRHPFPLWRRHHHATSFQ